MEKINVLNGIPYRKEGMGRRKLADDDHLLLIQAALKPGQAVPPHRADSNVRLLVIQGEIALNLAGEMTRAEAGDIVPVAPGTPMIIANRSTQDASFLIFKTPHPRTRRQGKEMPSPEAGPNPSAISENRD